MPPPLGDLTLAVSAAAQRLAVLLRSVRTPSVPALGSWDLTEVAVHATNAVEGITRLAQGEGPFIESLSDLATMTTRLVTGEEERGLAALADRIEAGAGELVAAVAEIGASGSQPWMVRGFDAPTTTILGHVLNELVVHAWDIAQADGTRWPIPAGQAALVLDAFVMPLLGQLGADLVDPVAAAGVTATFDVRVRGGGRHIMRFADGDLLVEEVALAASVAGVDCRMSVAPGAMLLVAWGRRSQWPAIARGQLMAWGRRPWLGVQLRSLLRNP